jgi:DNA repair exonuclease SbcCD ATPase subunit
MEGEAMSHELTEEQRKMCEEAGRGFRERTENYVELATGIIIHTIAESEMHNLARAIAEPLAERIAELEAKLRDARIEADGWAEQCGKCDATSNDLIKRVAELEAELERYKTADNHKTQGGFTSSSGMYYDV